MADTREVLSKIGNEVKLLRIQSIYSQEKLAELSDVDRTFIGSIERGEKNLSICILMQILDVFHVDLLTFIKNAYEHDTK